MRTDISCTSGSIGDDQRRHASNSSTAWTARTSARPVCSTDHATGNFAKLNKVAVTLAAARENVVGNANTVAEAKCATRDDGILDALDAVGFTRVNGYREQLRSQVVEGNLVAARQEALFGAGNVETDHTVVAVANGKLGNFKTAVGVTHCSD